MLLGVIAYCHTQFENNHETKSGCFLRLVLLVLLIFNRCNLFQLEFNHTWIFCADFFSAKRLWAACSSFRSCDSTYCSASRQSRDSFSGLLSSMPISSERSGWHLKYTDGSYTSFSIVWTAVIEGRRGENMNWQVKTERVQQLRRPATFSSVSDPGLQFSHNN